MSSSIRFLMRTLWGFTGICFMMMKQPVALHSTQRTNNISKFQEEAKAIQERIDERVDPCDDFYRFACNRWIESHDIPEHALQVSLLSNTANKVQSELRVLLEKELTGEEPEHVRKLKQTYDSCMDLESIEAEGSRPLENALKSLGGWPVLEGEGWKGQAFDWISTLIRMRQMGYNHKILVDIVVAPDARNNSINIISLDSAHLGIADRSYYMKGLADETLSAYFKLMVGVAKKLGADPRSAEAELMDALNFEIKLARFSLPKEERRNMSALYNRYTVKTLQEQVPQIDWMKYLNGLLNDPIPESEPLIIHDPSYIVKFADLITKTDKRGVANYMLWDVALRSLHILTEDWRHLTKEYVTARTGRKKEEPLWQRCMDGLAHLAIALGSYYAKNYFPKESRDTAQELVNYIHREFLNSLHNVGWMDHKTKKHAKEKARAIRKIIGYPDELLDDAKVSKLYENLTISKESYYENYMQLRKWTVNKEFSKLRKPYVKGEWTFHAIAHAVDAFYSAQENTIIFPAGILQPPFFLKDRPRYMNFGSIGYIIGHEITHGFDDEGRQFDKDGNYRNWWDAKTDALFRKKAECIINQYSNFTASTGQKLNGVNTQGENIADNAGLKEAYKAYQTWVKDHGPEGKLPGLKYTPNQLFWISAAGPWCGHFRPGALEKLVLEDVHSPYPFRVNGPLSNFREFSNDFRCEIGSPMNPRKKCEIWYTEKSFAVNLQHSFVAIWVPAILAVIVQQFCNF